MNQPDQPDLFTRYLLGELTAAERQQFERDCLADETCRAMLQAAEQELIDAYVRNELTAHEHEGFEKHFLVSTERARQVEFARALLKLAELGSVTSSTSNPTLTNDGKQKKSYWQRLLHWLRRYRFVNIWLGTN